MIKNEERTVIRITKEKKGLNDCFHTFKFIARALVKNSFRPVYNYIWVIAYGKKKYIAASDARILFYTDNLFEKELGHISFGAYEVVKNTAKEIILIEVDSKNCAFPDISKVIPDIKKCETKTLSWRDVNLGAKILYHVFGQGKCVNPLYLERACSGLSHVTIYSDQNSLNPILISHVHGCAVIAVQEIGKEE
jgi:hypothetical protein